MKVKEVRLICNWKDRKKGKTNKQILASSLYLIYGLKRRQINKQLGKKMNRCIGKSRALIKKIIRGDLGEKLGSKFDEMESSTNTSCFESVLEFLPLTRFDS